MYRREKRAESIEQQQQNATKPDVDNQLRKQETMLCDACAKELILRSVKKKNKNEGFANGIRWFLHR